LAEKARDRISAINSMLGPLLDFPFASSSEDRRDPEDVRAAHQAEVEKARKELGKAWELVEMGKDATIDHLLSELSVVDRLDGMIDRCLKRLLFVRGLKSIAPSSSTAPERLRIKGRAAA
jgi:hypothetical protein